MKQAYLLLYNALCGLSWGYCAARVFGLLLSANVDASLLWEQVRAPLTVAQTAMLLEIVHAVLGLVPSPVVTVAVQVLSRIFILWGHLYWVPACQQHWSLFSMVFAWSITETVRYAFYFTGLLGSVPYPIFWLRYSLFVVLYPTGIASELMQAICGMSHWHSANPLWFRMSVLVLFSYIPGSPLLIGNMWSNREKSLKKRAAESQPAAVEEPEGILWPKDKKGERSSTGTNQAILATAAGAGPGGKAAAAKVAGERKWRFKYNEHLLEHVSQSLESAEGCLNMARAGLQAAHEKFTFRPPKGSSDVVAEVSARAAMETYCKGIFETAEIQGEGKKLEQPRLELMYGGPTAGQPYYNFKRLREKKISGDVLRKQLDEWAAYGTIEPDVAEALKTVQDHEGEWLDLSDQYFVLLGAGSAMGPLLFLLALGANVVAVAQSRTLRKLMDKAKKSPGRLIFPVLKGSDWSEKLKAGDLDGVGKVAGCNLMTQAPEIAAWVKTVCPGKSLTIGNYTYLDAAKHVQIAIACDLIMESVCAARKNTALAFLGTPTDAHVIPEEAATAISTAYKNAPAWMKAWESLGVLKPTRVLTSGGFKYIDAIVPDQGPNYILAKRLQHWRAVVARADGHTVSSSVAPSAATASVTSNASFAAAFGGMHIFKPMEVVYQELAMTCMAALLIFDLRSPTSAAKASTKLPHPLCLFERTSFHGGIARCPYSIATIGIPSAVKYYLTTFWVQILLGVVASLVLVQYVVTGTLPEAVSAGTTALAAKWGPRGRALGLPV
eukprot:TRINITY_DN23544_c0_g3_i3.p1 TRINITY_DN23544_c0_g3~~TRINITY_DN23544_c0_g3_i3.p1  ORF type:complete len:779 (+),score=181.98 TRINITY_DN23544_c0_g3_i3:83-2419(+)